MTEEEWAVLRSQNAILSEKSTGRGQHRKYLPYVFAEHGTIMAATILNSPRAIGVSVYVVRAFVALREMLSGHQELALRLDDLERRIQHRFESHDQAIVGILQAIRELMKPPEPVKKRSIGLVTEEEKPRKGG